MLSEAQRARLLAAARQYIAPEEEQANQVALEIDFIEGANEHASTMCGPLSISILRSAELLGLWARPADFWLLNPREEIAKVQKVFPEELYYWYAFDTPISQFDFRQQPLVAGDMLYLHAGSGDTFEHILVVNRVEADGRAYTVSNFFTETGTIIEERMLYDPARPGEGQFQRWADRQYRNTIGITGSGGFRIWRVRDGRNLEFPRDAASLKLRNALDTILLNGGGDWYARIAEIGGQQLCLFNPYERFHPASTLKVPIAMAFYAWLETQPVEDLESYLEEHGTSGRTYAQLLQAMIVESEEEATQHLVDFLGAEWIEATWEGWGLEASQVDPRRSTALETTQALEALYLGRWIAPRSREHLLELMATYTPNDNARLGLIRDRLPPNSQIYNKRGSLVGGPRVVGDSGIIELGGTGGRAFSLSIHGLGRDGSSYETLEAKLDAAILAFGDFLSSL